MEKKKTDGLEKSPARRPYRCPELTRYQRLQEMTRGDSPTGNGGSATCTIEAHCTSNPV